MRPNQILTFSIVATLMILAACGGQHTKVCGNDAQILKPTGDTSNMTKTYSQAPTMSIDATKKYCATMKTSKGSIKLELYGNEAPLAVNNFIFLSREGFYDGVIFHRIVKDFMIQGGDPDGTGAGGPGYRFNDEPVTLDYIPGTLAMANAGPNTNGSQFFIMHGNVNLPKQYTIFGQVTDGLDIIDAIANTPVTRSPSGELSTPTENVVIEEIIIEEAP